MAGAGLAVAGALSAEGRGALCRVQEGAAEGDVPLEDAAGGRRAYAERPRLEQHAVGLEEGAGEAALHVSVAARSQLGSQDFVQACCDEVDREPAAMPIVHGCKEVVGSATEPLDDGAVVLHVLSEARVLLGCVAVRRNTRCGWRSVAGSGCVPVRRNADLGCCGWWSVARSGCGLGSGLP